MRVRKGSRTLGLLTLGLVTFWALVAAYAVGGTYLGDRSGLRLQGHVLPENWAFFTIEPRAEYPFIFRRAGDRWVPLKASLSDHALGVSRATRLIDEQAQTLWSELPDDAWTSCDRLPGQCAGALHAIEMENTFSRPYVCGEILIARATIAAREHADRSDFFQKPFMIVKLNVIC